MFSWLGSLAQSCCEEGWALQTNITGVRGALTVFRSQWVCPRSRHVCFPQLHCSGSRLLYRERALRCVHFRGLSHSGSIFRVLHKEAASGLRFVPSPARAAQAARSLRSALSPGAVRLLPSAVPASVSACLERLVSLLGSWSLAATLSTLPSPSLPLSPPFCLLRPAGDRPVHSRLALLQNCSVLPLFCQEPAVSSVRAFCRLIFSLSLAIPQFKLPSQVSSLRLPSGHSSQVLTLSNAACSSPFSSHLLVVDASVWGTFLLGVAFPHVIREFY